MGLADAKVGAAIAVSDMQRSKDFYEGKLGLSGGRETGDGGVTYTCGGGSEVHIFPSPEGAGKSPSTLAGFEVEDLEATVEELSGNGVGFEQYSELNTDERGIADFGGGTKGAWLKDPDGNVLALVGS
jgi:catechol 2,3-dioxygenase-like lactoylglutathione lyase family enzyme